MPNLSKDDFAARAARALAVAETTSDPEIAAVHRRLAASYLELIELTKQADHEAGQSTVQRQA